MGWVLDAEVGDPVAKLVLLILANRAGDDGWNSFPGQESIATQVEVSLDTIQRKLAALEESGWIIRERRGGYGEGRAQDRYYLACPWCPDAPEEVIERSRERVTERMSERAVKEAEGAKPQRAVLLQNPRGATPQLHGATPHLHGGNTAPVRPRNEPSVETSEETSVPPVVPQPPMTMVVPIRPGLELPTSGDSAFFAFWQAYPRKIAKGDAYKAWGAAIKLAEPVAIVQAAQRYADDPTRDPKFTPYPATWLRAERWDDGPAEQRRPDTRAAQSLQAMRDPSGGLPDWAKNVDDPRDQRGIGGAS